MKKYLLRIAGVVLLLIILPILYLTGVIMMAGNGVPEVSGKLAHSSLTSEVTITRDEHGIPHITATNEADLYFAQGFVHAQDRFWQIALNRQATLGRLSEWYGSSTIRADRYQRMLGWQDVADKAYQKLTSEEQALLKAYADGINAWLASDNYEKPPEMRILHVDPEPWQPRDSFLMFYAIHSVLYNTGNEYLSALLKHNEFSEYAAEMLDTSKQISIPIIPSESNDTLEQETASKKEKTFSSNWTLSGAHTETGLPLMASDPQLPVALPNTWHIQSHNLNGRLIAGASFPGSPGIAIGHNSYVAWGITNGQIDVQDFALIEQHPDNDSLYRRSSESDWETYEERTEEIIVRFGDNFQDTVRKTSLGIASPMNFSNALVGDMKNTHIEMRDIAFDVPGTDPIAMIKLNQANDVKEAITAVSGLTSVAYNISFADTKGNIGYVLSGRVAIRDKQHANTIDFYPKDSIEWEVAPFEANPRVINPQVGRIVSANQKIIDDSYPYYLGVTWGSPIRTKNIHDMLDKKTKHSVASFLAMQSNTLSPFARDLSTLMLSVKPASESDAKLATILKEWDHHFDLDSEAPIIWATWMASLQQKLFSDDFAGNPRFSFGNRYNPMIRALSGEKPEWCDDVTTESTEDCAEMLQTSLTQARQILEEKFGADPAAWQWGKVVSFQTTHQGLGRLPIVGSQFNRHSAFPGGPGGLFLTDIILSEAPTFKNTQFNSSYQAIFDLSDLENSLFMFSGGSSGHYKSPHYDDMTARWIAGERFKLQREVANPEAVFTLSPE